MRREIGRIGGGRRAGLALFMLIALSSPAHAETPVAADGWNFAVRPYLWLPSIDGTLRYEIPPGGEGGANVDLASYVLENLSFALMLSAEARKGNLSILTDLVYLDVESDESTVESATFTGPGGRVDISAGADLGTEVRLSGILWELGGAYTVARGRASHLDVLGGFRYFSIEAETDWQLSASIAGPGPGQSFAAAGSTSQREELWDGIIGFRGLVGLGRGKWAIPYYLDVGTGTSALTWQAMAGIEYRFGWGDVQLVYRYLFYDMKSDEMLQNVSLYGPALGVNFRF